MKVLRKIVCKTKIGKIRCDIVTRMDVQILVKISRDNVPEEDLQDALKQDGATQFLIKSGRIAPTTRRIRRRRSRF